MEVDRTTYIGGSDAAVLVGEDDYKDPVRLFWEKRGDLPREVESNERMYWGTVHEKIIADAYTDRTGWNVRRVPFLAHREHTFIGGHIDREVLGVPRILEIKNHGWYMRDKYGDPGDGAEAVPNHIKMQCYHYLQLKPNAEFCDVAALFGGNEMEIFTLPRPEEAISALTALEVEFWNNLETGIPPAFSPRHATTQQLLRELYPNSNGEMIELPERLLSTHELYVSLSAKQKALRSDERDIGKELEACRNELEAAMGDSPVMRVPGGGSYTRKWVEKKGHTVEPHRYPLFRFKAAKKGIF